MTKILLTGGSGFLAGHILDSLLARGHTVVTTVRNEGKASQLLERYGRDGRIEVVIVPDIAQDGAFDEVARTPGLETVCHTASPFHYDITDPYQQLVEPAVAGTVGLLRALAQHAPTIAHVVLTSSFAAMLDESKLRDPETTFDEHSWNPDSMEDIYRSPNTAYRISKKLAEQEAWSFMRDEKPSFSLVTANPVLIFGPPVKRSVSAVEINTSNQRFVDIMNGKWRDQIPESDDIQLWVDVRDAALAHVHALEAPALRQRRLLIAAGRFSNREIADIVRAGFPSYAAQVPLSSAGGGEQHSAFRWDTSRTDEILKITYRSLKESVVDTVSQLQGPTGS